MPKPLTDLEVHDRLHEAFMLFSGQTGETGHGNTTIKTAHRVLMDLQIALMLIEAKADGMPLPPGLEGEQPPR